MFANFSPKSPDKKSKELFELATCHPRKWDRKFHVSPGAHGLTQCVGREQSTEQSMDFVTMLAD